MAQKFGNSRWVSDGFLDNRVDGTVVGRITFAAIGPIDFYLVGNFKGEIAGKLIQFRNNRFEDEELAGHALGEIEVPQIGDVSLVSFDPHPHLTPHPYIEWFSVRKNHYRIELIPEDAWIVPEAEAARLDPEIQKIREALKDRYAAMPAREESDWV